MPDGPAQDELQDGAAIEQKVTGKTADDEPLLSPPSPEPGGDDGVLGSELPETKPPKPEKG